MIKRDIFYNLLSSFQKSVRGSDVNAALHYLARLLEGETWFLFVGDYLLWRMKILG